MSEGKRTPGPFQLEAMGCVYRHDRFALRLSEHLDNAECAEIIDLLNKGTHYDAELKAAMDTHAAITAKLGEVAAQRDALKAAAEDAEYWLVEHDAGPATVLEELQSAIAACEGGQDAEG